MAFSNLRKRLTTTVVELDQARLQERYQGLDLVPIAAAPEREPVRLGGEVQETRVVPRAGSPSLEVTIADGSGRAIAVFTGRTKIAGLHLGRGIVVEGVCRMERGHLLLMNPAYSLLV